MDEGKEQKKAQVSSNEKKFNMTQQLQSQGSYDQEDRIRQAKFEQSLGSEIRMHQFTLNEQNSQLSSNFAPGIQSPQSFGPNTI